MNQVLNLQECGERVDDLYLKPERVLLQVDQPVTLK